MPVKSHSMPIRYAAPLWQRGIAVALLLALLIFIWRSGSLGEGRDLSFSLVLGSLFGIILQRSRFCFFCMTRDFIDHRDSRGLLGLVVALAAGTLGYIAIFGAMLPIPAPGRLPPDAHIGPVSWILALAAWIFGAGMAISGSCISAHLYRLGEGAIASVFALPGVLIGFMIGFQTWNFLYLQVIQAASVVWLPNHLGYGGTVIVQLSILMLDAPHLGRHCGRCIICIAFAVYFDCIIVGLYCLR